MNGSACGMQCNLPGSPAYVQSHWLSLLLPDLCSSLFLVVHCITTQDPALKLAVRAPGAAASAAAEKRLGFDVYKLVSYFSSNL